VTKKFKKPENGYAELEGDALAELKDVALDEYAELAKVPDDELSDEQLERLEELKTEITAMKAEETTRAEAETARADRIAAAKAGLDDEDDEDDDGEEESEEKDAESEDAEEEDASEDAEEKEDALVASATGLVARRAARRRRGAAAAEEPEIESPKAVITVAPDVRGYSSGQEVEGLRGLSEAFKARTSTFKSGTFRKGEAGRISTFGVATIKRPLAGENRPEIGEGATPEDVYNKLMGLALQARRARGEAGVDALTAAAYNGWVVPSENLYDLCSWATFSGGLQLPSTTVRRGGINRTKGIDFSVVFNDADGYFHYTEDQMETRPTKPFRMLDVPTWDEFRLDSIGYGVRAPIPLRNSFPELLDDYMDKSLVAYQHYVNAAVIQKVLTLIGGGSAPTPVTVPGYGGATADTLQTMEMIRHQFIQKYSLADNQVLEFIFPSWYRTVLKADLSRRNGWDNPFGVTDAQIDGWFRTRGARTQYIRDWSGQDLSGDVTDIALPGMAQFMVWVPGTYVRGGDEIISLDAIYDQANLEKNEYIAAFFEESLLVADTCGEGELYEIGLDPYGLVGAAILGAPES
jgi:hypothetical protein